jgi:hypothetical protein
MYLRVGGPFLYGNHVLTALVICAIPIYFSCREGYSRMPIWLSCIFATVFFHELVLQTFGVLPYGFGLIEHQLFSYYMLALFLFTVAAFKFGNGFQRKTLWRIALVTLLTSGGAMLIYWTMNYHPMTLAQFSPGPQAYSFIPNTVENILWWVPLSVWFWSKK